MTNVQRLKCQTPNVERRTKISAQPGHSTFNVRRWPLHVRIYPLSMLNRFAGGIQKGQDT